MIKRALFITIDLSIDLFFAIGKPHFELVGRRRAGLRGHTRTASEWKRECDGIGKKGTSDKISFPHCKLRTSVIVRRASR